MIPIYKQEVLDGLSHQIKTTAKIEYQAPIRSLKASAEKQFNFTNERLLELAQSSKRDISDLHPFASILVSVGGQGYGWNDNDDVFDSTEAWAARNSPVNKQLNYMHNEKQIIGHMTDVLVLDPEGNLISDDVEYIPDKYDIAVANVLYKRWTDEELQKLADKIIAGIPNNEWFVSMECLFSNFDYALVSPANEHVVLPRNQSTAFLTKHLRCYGGTGVYEEYRVGRLIRDLIFSGNAIVDNPANPRSIIFSGETPFQTKATKVTFPKTETKSMSDNNDAILQDLKDRLAKAEARNDKQEEAMKTLVAETQKQEQDKLQKEIASLKVDNEDLQAKVDAKTTKLDETEAALEKLQKEHKQALAEMEEKDKELEKTKKEKSKASRVAKLVDAGASHTEAEAMVEKFSSLSDEEFDGIVELKAQMKDKAQDDDKKKKKEKEKAGTNLTDETLASAIRDADVEDGDLSMQDDETSQDDLEAERHQAIAAAGAAWFSKFRKTKESK